ncbi:MAG: hypothetical protein ABSH35_02515 [Isosphaeraceae bacterium]
MDLLGRARSLFKGLGTPPVAKVQYYSVVCPLGHRLRGRRTGGCQALRCPSCGAGIFVLPASPLPEPVAPERPARARTAIAARADVDEGPIELKDPAQVTVDIVEPDDLAVEAEIIWDDEVAGEASPAPDGGDRDDVDRAGPQKPAAVPDQNVNPRSHPRRPAPRPAGSGVPASPAPAAATAKPSPGATPTTGRPEAARRRQPATLDPGPGARVPVAATRAGTSDLAQPRTARGPGRRPLVVLACVAVLALGTLAWRTWRQRWENLPQVARIGATEGIAALEEGKFDHANQLLSAAREAVDALGGAVEDADKIRHAADEAAIFVNLLTDSLESLLDEAARTSPQAWADRFNTIYKGRTVVIEATITATPDTAGSHRYELDYLVLAAGQGAREQRYARIDLTGFEAITLVQHKEGDHVVFGGRLAAFQYDPEAQEWMIRFEPKSGVSIKYYKALQSMGWPSGSSYPDDSPEGPDQP